jgi:hypothetical protein
MFSWMAFFEDSFYSFRMMSDSMIMLIITGNVIFRLFPVKIDVITVSKSGTESMCY